jgi:hypothetical protein
MIRFEDILDEIPLYYAEKEYEKRVAKVKLVVTKIKCPACMGDGLYQGFLGTICPLCRGETRINKKLAIEYATVLWRLSNFEDMEGEYVLSPREMKSKANEIRRIFGEEELSV